MTETLRKTPMSQSQTLKRVRFPLKVQLTPRKLERLKPERKIRKRREERT